jgi:hypothetical protein
MLNAQCSMNRFMRKQALPPELANLADEQLAQVNYWLDRFTYEKTRKLFFETHGIDIGRMKLTRYNQRRLKARALSRPGQSSFTAADLIAIKNGTPIPDERLNNELLQRRVLDLVRNVKSAYELRELHQVVTYDQRRHLKEKETALAERAAEHRLWRADFRERDLAFRRAKAAAHSNHKAVARFDPPPIPFPEPSNTSKISQ